MKKSAVWPCVGLVSILLGAFPAWADVKIYCPESATVQFTGRSVVPASGKVLSSTAMTATLKLGSVYYTPASGRFACSYRSTAEVSWSLSSGPGDRVAVIASTGKSDACRVVSPALRGALGTKVWPDGARSSVQVSPIGSLFLDASLVKLTGVTSNKAGAKGKCSGSIYTLTPRLETTLSKQCSLVSSGSGGYVSCPF